MQKKNWWTQLPEPSLQMEPGTSFLKANIGGTVGYVFEFAKKKTPLQPNRTFLHPHRLAGLHFHLSVCSQKEPLRSNLDHCSSPNSSKKKKSDEYKTRTQGFLVAQWIRISLPVQESWVRSLIWEDPTCCGGTCIRTFEPVLQSPGATTAEVRAP